MSPQAHCKKCDLTFRSRGQLRIHYWETNIHPSCQKCGFGFLDQEAKKEHLRTSPAHEYCYVCERGFSSFESLQKHYLRDDSHPECCGIGFLDDLELNSHVRNNHGTVKSEANQTSPDESAPWKSTLPLQTICTKCLGVFGDEIQWANHIQINPNCAGAEPRGADYVTVYDHRDAKLYCRLCGSEFSKLKKLHEHSWDVHHVKLKFKDGPRECWFCHDQFENRGALRAHFQDTPSHRFDSKFEAVDARNKNKNGEKEDTVSIFQCFACRRIFRTREMLEKHQFIFSGTHQHKECPICMVKYQQFSDLKAHFDSHLFGYCPECSTAFLTNEAFEFHIQSNTNRTYCQDCNNQFSSACVRLQHQCVGSVSIDTLSESSNSTPHEQVSQEATTDVSSLAYLSPTLPVFKKTGLETSKWGPGGEYRRAAENGKRAYPDRTDNVNDAQELETRHIPLPNRRDDTQQHLGTRLSPSLSRQSDFINGDTYTTKTKDVTRPKSFTFGTPDRLFRGPENHFDTREMFKKSGRTGLQGSKWASGGEYQVAAEYGKQTHHSAGRFDRASGVDHTRKEANISEPAHVKALLAPKETNVAKQVPLKSPLTNPDNLIAYLSGSMLGKAQKEVAKKVEPMGQRTRNIKPASSQDIGCGICKKQFSTNSEMATHMESGTCLFRDETGIYSYVLRLDATHSFTVPEMIDYLKGTINRTKQSNESHYDGLNKTYNCPYCKAAFGDSQRLDAHLKGPLHDAKVYRCPGSKNCGQRFSRIGDLLRHIEDLQNPECNEEFVGGTGGMAGLKDFVDKVFRSGT